MLNIEFNTKIIELLKTLPPSHESSKAIRLEKIKMIENELDKMETIRDEKLNELNQSIAEKSYCLVKSQDGKIKILDPDLAYSATYQERFKEFMQRSNDKKAAIDALLQFMSQLSELPEIMKLMQSKFSLIDIGAGDGVAISPVLKFFNKYGKVHYTAVEREKNFYPKLKENIELAEVEYQLYMEDFRKIEEKLINIKSNINVFMHLYSTTPPDELIAKSNSYLNVNGISTFVHNTSDTSMVTFRREFNDTFKQLTGSAKDLLKLADKDITEVIQGAVNVSNANSITTTYESILNFPTLSKGDWEQLKKIKQADYTNKYNEYSPELLAAKHLIDFILSDKLEAFSSSVRNLILDSLKEFLEKNKYQLVSYCKIQIVLSVSHTPEFLLQFNALKSKIENNESKENILPIQANMAGLSLFKPSPNLVAPEVSQEQCSQSQILVNL